jgi:hypothetical protein
MLPAPVDFIFPAGVDAGHEDLELLAVGFDGPVAVIEGEEFDDGAGGEAGRECVVEAGVVDGEKVTGPGDFLTGAHWFFAPEDSERGAPLADLPVK